MTGNNTKFIVLSGPTAVGKSSIAMKLASDLSVPIISADSRQVFKEISIGTAKPSVEDRKKVKHFWVDSKSITEKVSAGTFINDVKNYIEDESISLAIICGGTNFYIESLLYGLDEKPSISEKASNKVKRLYKNDGLKALQEEVKALDPKYYDRVDQQNHRRLQRALQVIYSTDKPYSSFHDKNERKLSSYSHLSFFLSRDRDILYDRINKRVDKMIKKGLEQEAKELYDRKHLQNLQTVGYQEFFRYFDGEISRKEAIRLIKRNTRRYAKRQLSWYRRSRFKYRYRERSKTTLIRREIDLFLLKHSIY